MEKRSIELLEKIYDENNHCSSWEIRWELLSDYLYIDDYDKVEALIADWFYDKHPNNKEPMLQTILDEYRHRNLVLACMVLAKEKYHLSLKTKPSRQISYYEQQMKDGQQQRHGECIQSHDRPSARISPVSDRKEGRRGKDGVIRRHRRRAAPFRRAGAQRPCRHQFRRRQAQTGV